VAGFPDLDYCGGSAPARQHQPTLGLACLRGEAAAGWVPTFGAARSMGAAASFPLRACRGDHTDTRRAPRERALSRARDRVPG